VTGVECETEVQSHARYWLRGLRLAHGTRRCGARCRTRSGLPCRGPAMKNGRCRMHGGGAGAPAGPRNGRYRHGRYTIGAKAMMTEVRRLTRALAAMCEDNPDPAGPTNA